MKKYNYLVEVDVSFSVTLDIEASSLEEAESIAEDRQTKKYDETNSIMAEKRRLLDVDANAEEYGNVSYD